MQELQYFLLQNQGFVSQICMQNPQPMSLSNLIVLGKLGRGSTSHVFRAQSTRDKKLYAMKVFDKKAKNYSIKALQKQLQLHRQLNHGSIVQLVAHIEDTDNHYVLTEYCSQGELTKLAMENLSEAQIAKIAFQVAHGLEYLHSQGIAHCDLKLSNLLMQNDQIKICDFGFSRRINETTLGNVCGTILYMAPQIVKDKKRKYYKQADIWALGICLLILITKKEPYDTGKSSGIAQQILDGKRTKLPEVSSELNDLLTKIFENNPKKRINLKDIMAHPFVLKYRLSFESVEISPKEQKIYKSLSLAAYRSKKAENNLTIQKDFSEVTKEQQHSEPVHVKAGKDQSQEQRWEFKRKSKVDDPEINVTQKKVSILITNDNDTTVKPRRLLKSATPKKRLEDQSQKKVKKENKHTLQPLDAKLINPLKESYYETKNQGFIKISSEGDVFIRVKGVTFSVTDNGHIITVGSSSFTLQQINNGVENSKQIYNYYEYASKLIQILKAKRFSSQYLFEYEGEQLRVGQSKDKGKITILTTVQKKRVVIEFCSTSQICQYHQGASWQKITLDDQKQKKLKQIADYAIEKFKKYEY